MKIESIKQKIEKEENEIVALKEKRASLDKKIKEKEEKVGKWKATVLESEIKSLTQNLSKNGMSLDDLQRAIAKGDLTEIQSRLSKEAD